MTERPEHLAPVILNDRGFSGLPPVQGAYGGDAMVWESSAAEYPRLWLKVNEPVNLNEPTGPTKDATVHLDAATAWQLAEQLMMLVQHHYQGDSRPAARAYDEVPEKPGISFVWPRWGWNIPEHVQVEEDVAHQTVALTCLHESHTDGKPGRGFRDPMKFDHRMGAFLREHEHQPRPCTCENPDGPHHPNCSISIESMASRKD
jgi:hypothetical protein